MRRRVTLGAADAPAVSIDDDRERCPVTLSSHLVLRVAVIFLVVRVLVDLATPLLPGAFRLNPNESVEAAAGSHQLVVSFVNVQPPPSAQRTAPESRASCGPAVRRPEPRVGRQLRGPIPRVTYFTEPASSSSTPDDD